MGHSIKFFVEIIKSNSLIKTANNNNLFLEDLKNELSKLQIYLGFELIQIESSLNFRVTELGKEFHKVLMKSPNY
jgi:hypothetical protein